MYDSIYVIFWKSQLWGGNRSHHDGDSGECRKTGRGCKGASGVLWMFFFFTYVLVKLLSKVYDLYIFLFIVIFQSIMYIIHFSHCTIYNLYFSTHFSLNFFFLSLLSKDFLQNQSSDNLPPTNTCSYRQPNYEVEDTSVELRICVYSSFWWRDS